MKLFSKGKDGGPESSVTGYWLCEFKSLFSIVLLKFEGKSREVYHEHAFNSISWLLGGILVETLINRWVNIYYPSLKPIITKRDTYHKVDSYGTSWVLSFRGPWSKTWREWDCRNGKTSVLENGRKVVG